MIIINEIRKIPFFRLIIPFVLGIFFQINYPLPGTYIIVPLVLLVFLTILYRYYYDKRLTYHKRWVMGVWIMGTFFLAGIVSLSIHQQKRPDIIGEGIFIGKIIEPVKETGKTVKVLLELKVYQTDSDKKSHNEKILLYIKKDSLSKTLVYGDLIVFTTRLRSIENSGNPDEFDYKNYLAGKSIFFQAYVDTANWHILAHQKGNFLYATAYKLRQKLLDVYKANNITGNEFAILAALTLGVKDYLSPEILQNYATSGAMHILAVSGLHVGIIYLILYSLLFFMQKTQILRFLQAVILILFIWLFALITGLSPSVTRASIMLTFIIVGNASARRPSVYNSIAVSAFLILIVNPLAILQVGFQLSYLAVIAIVYFQPKIYRLLNPKNIILDKAWALTAVSIAAQIGTFPISLYYFHKFPVYFFITNLIAIPAAYFIISFAIALLVFSPVSFLTRVFSYLLTETIIGLNVGISLIEQLPFSSVNQISFSQLESLLLYLFIIFSGIFILNRNKKNIILALISLVVFFSLKSNREIRALKKPMFIVFNSKSVPLIGIKQNQNLTIITDSTFSENKKSTAYVLDNLLTNKFVADTFVVRSDIEGGQELAFYKSHFIQFLNFRAVLLNNKLFDKKESTSKLKTDIVILSKGFSANVQDLLQLFRFNQLVLDATIPNWQEKTIMRDCAALNISVHNVKESGAFIKDW
jgi:competence protein ComEC